MQAKLRTIPPGDAGTYATVRQMVALIRAEAPVLRGTAAKIAGAGNMGGPLNAARVSGALFRYVRDAIANVDDPPGIEWLQAPSVTLGEFRGGDCDDKTTLLGALMRASGIPVRLVVIGPRARVLSHVYLEAALGGRWVAFDPKNPRAVPGWAYPNPRRLERVMV